MITVNLLKPCATVPPGPIPFEHGTLLSYFLRLGFVFHTPLRMTLMLPGYEYEYPQR